jgi:toxin ParE1/3/4
MSVPELRVHLSHKADRDIEDIFLYSIRAWGEDQATVYQMAFDQALQSLHEYPHIGWTRDDVFPGCRSLAVKHHIMYYHQPGPNVVEVLRILHRRQDAQRMIDPPIN